MEGGHISLNGVGHGVHAGVSGQLLGHGLRQSRVHNGHIGGDVEVSQGVLHALVIVGDHGEGGHFSGGAGGGRDGAEVGLGAELGEVEGDAEGLEGGVGVLIEGPHCLGGVDGGAAAHCNDPVGLELTHGLGALHHRLHRGIRLHALKELDLHAGLLQIAFNFVQEAKALHAAAADNNHRPLAFQGLQGL